MEKYEKIEKPREEPEIKDNEIRITTKGKMRNSISYATTLFKEKGFNEVILKAMGRAINKTVTIAEIIKRRIPNLHQITEISSTDITDVYEPLEEGLDRIETTRHVSSITIILSTLPLDTSTPGYQAPLPEDQVKTPAASAMPVPVSGAVQPPKGTRRPRASQGPRGKQGDLQENGDSSLQQSSAPIGEGAASPVTQPTDAQRNQQASAAGRPFRGRGRGRRGGNVNHGGNGFAIQTGYPQQQQGFVSGYPQHQPQVVVGGFGPTGVHIVQSMPTGGGGRGGSVNRGRGRRGRGAFLGFVAEQQPGVVGAIGVQQQQHPRGGRGRRGARGDEGREQGSANQANRSPVPSTKSSDQP